jgi:glycosyltransferase involved in cell wall biosynthesis
MVVENMSVPADRRVWLEARALVRAGYQVTVICPAGTDRDREPSAVIDGVAIHRFELLEAGGGPLSYLREYGTALYRIGRLARKVDRERHVDVVHLCNPPDVLFLAVRPLVRRGARVVFDHHDLVPELYEARFGRRGGLFYKVAGFFERRTFRMADIVISPNESYREIAVSRGRKRPEDVFVVRIAPDSAVFAPVPSDPSLRDGASHLIAYAGTIGPQDGVDHALRALELLARDRRDWRAVFAGRGDWRDEAIALATRLGLSDRVAFPGHLGDGPLIRLLSSADVCIAPEPSNGLNESSTMIKVVEYMALGRPIVAYDIRETRFSAGEAALYATPNDPAALASCIERLLDDEALRASMGAEGRRRIQGDLAWRHSEAALKRAYARLLEST